MSERPAAADRHTASVDADGRVALPEELLRRLAWKPGEHLAATIEPDGSVRLARPASGEGEERLAALRAVQGMWRDRDDLPDPDQLRREWDRERSRES